MERGHEAWALRLLGEIAARHDPEDPKAAEAHYQQALGLATDLGMRPLSATATSPRPAPSAHGQAGGGSRVPHHGDDDVP